MYHDYCKAEYNGVSIFCRSVRNWVSVIRSSGLVTKVNLSICNRYLGILSELSIGYSGFNLPV